MGTLNRFTDKLIFVDTMPFIYHIEEHPVYVDTVEAFFVGALCDKNYRLTSANEQLFYCHTIQPMRDDVNHPTKQVEHWGEFLVCKRVLRGEIH